MTSLANTPYFRRTLMIGQSFLTPCARFAWNLGNLDPEQSVYLVIKHNRIQDRGKLTESDHSRLSGVAVVRQVRCAAKEQILPVAVAFFRSTVLNGAAHSRGQRLGVCLCRTVECRKRGGGNVSC